MRMRDGGLIFEWDQAKNRLNLRKHGIDFAEAPALFRGILLTAPDTRKDYGEDRWQGIGMVRGRVVVVVFSQPAPETVRIISLRKAIASERRMYEKALEDGLEEG